MHILRTPVYCSAVNTASVKVLSMSKHKMRDLGKMLGPGYERRTKGIISAEQIP